MGTHTVLYAKVVANLRGERPAPYWPVGERRHGSVNYWMMNSFTVWRYLLSPKSEQALLDTFAEFKKVGHLSLAGPSGVACEQGAPGAHWYFNLAPALGVFRFAAIEKRVDLESAAISFLLDEAGLDRAFRYNKATVLPAPRIKDEKDMTPRDKYRDTFTALALGEKVKKPADYWRGDQAAAVRTMKQIVEEGLWPTAAAKEAKIPKLYLPILRRDLPGGGYLAWIEKTPEAVTAMSRDAVNWVRVGPGIPLTPGRGFGYDWSTVPETT